jgi:lysophospholipid acyltransferase (LPLAT)-like uncharacterized protein
MKWLVYVASWALALVILAWRSTCRYRVENDPRPALRARGQPYVLAVLHAHQVAGALVNDERPLFAMLSRSTDGDLAVTGLRLRRVHAVRGSTRKGSRDKGGREALAQLIELVKQRKPGLLAVDGPRGPRNHVHRGIADLALGSGAVILPAIVLARPRFILKRTWDRLQAPLPFALVRLIFGEPVVPQSGESTEALRQRVRIALDTLERREDPTEAPPFLRPDHVLKAVDVDGQGISRTHTS